MRARPSQRSSIVTVLVAACLLTLPAMASADLPKEYSKGIARGSQPYAITPGPDGNMWFTEAADAVGKITPGGTVTEYREGITQGANPTGITVGPGGALWFTEAAGRIGRIDSSGIVTEFSAGISAGAAPNDITFAGGDLWFTEASGIGRMTPDGTVTEYTAGITPGSRPWEIVAGRDGSLWFTEQLGAAIGRIDRAGVVTEFRAGLGPGASPLGIAAGPDGNIWFTDESRAVGRITPLGMISVFKAGIALRARPAAITAGGDDNLWFTESPGVIARLTPTGNIFEFPNGITPGAGLTSIARGHDNKLWFTERDGGRIGRTGTNTVAFVLRPAKRAGRFFGVLDRIELSQKRGTPMSVVCVRGCSRPQRRGRIPADPTKAVSLKLAYRHPLEVYRDTVLEIRATLSPRTTRWMRFGFTRSGTGSLRTPRLGSGCFNTQRHRQRVPCPPA